jgi:hypothetical protein
MVDITLILGNILDRAAALGRLEAEARPLVLAYGVAEWPLGNGIKEILGDVQNLVARVEKLEAALASRRDEPSLVGALIGSLRAAGYQVTDPNNARFADTSDGSALLERFFDEQERGVSREPPVFDLDTAASDMLGEDAPQDDGASEEAGTVCKKCKGALVTPGGPCRYLDCRRKSEADSVAEAADPPTAAEVPAAKGRRAEPPKLVTEWAPEARDFDGYAKDLGCDVARIQSLVASFKDWAAKSEPDQRQARWGGTFKAWAKARLSNQP